MPQTNAFGHKIISIPEILKDRKVYNLICDVLTFQSFVVTGKNNKPLVKTFLDHVLSKQEQDRSAEAVRKKAMQMVGGEVGLKKIRDVRAQDIITSFKKFVESSDHYIHGKVLDLGCGSGLIASGLKNEKMKSIELCDVVDYMDQTVKMKFTTIPTQGRLPYKDGEFDSVLAITVLHHASNPIELLKEINRITKERFYLMETIIDVTPKSRTVEEIGDQRSELEKKFSNLDKNQQMIHACFQDWFYNDVVQGGVDVPMNFATDSQWKGLLSELKVNLVSRYMLGFDQRTSGEYHVIYVCEKT